MDENPARIRALNDTFRRTFAGGKVLMTASIQALPADLVARALDRVRSFNEFTEDNDPHGEHDFGSFDIDGQKFFFKIDYFDQRLEFGSEDPSDPARTARVLTLMLAADY
jgi:hypothetical protein